MQTPVFQWRRFAGFAVLFGVLFCATTPACRSLQAETAPAEVRTAVAMRSIVLAQAVADASLVISDEAMLQLLQDEELAWVYLRDNAGLLASVDFTNAVKSNAVAVRVAKKKVEAHEYTDQQKEDLLRALQASWTALDAFYTPKNPPMPTN